MTLSRPLLLALVGAVLVVAAFTATRGMRAEVAPPPPSTPAPSAPAAKPSNATSATGARSAAGATSAAGAKPGAAARPSAANGAEAPGAAKPAAPAQAEPDPGMPPAISRALARRRPVVLFLGQRGPADDTATRQAVRKLRRARVTVAHDDIANVARYGAVIRQLGLVQAPATIVIDRQGKARALEGYLDLGSLRQLVADARR